MLLYQLFTIFASTVIQISLPVVVDKRCSIALSKQEAITVFCCVFVTKLSLSFSFHFSYYFCCCKDANISFTVFSYLCFISSTLRRWDKSAAIQELFSFLGIGTKKFLALLGECLRLVLMGNIVKLLHNGLYFISDLFDESKHVLVLSINRQSSIFCVTN